MARDEARTIEEVLKAVRRLKEFKRVSYLACDDHLSQMVTRLLEYEARRTNTEVLLTLEKIQKDASGASIKGVPSLTVGVKVERRSVADLLRSTKKSISKGTGRFFQ